MSDADQRLAARLAAREEHAEHAATTAMASGNWAVAAELEEKRVCSQHELAGLLLERRLEAQQGTDE